MNPGTSPGQSDLTDQDLDLPRQQTKGRWISLAPIRPVDYDFIRSAELSDDLGVRWRHRGGTPSPESFSHALWAGVLSQFLVISTADNSIVGLVSAYNADLASGTCYVGFARFGPGTSSPHMIEGIVLFIDHLFKTWPLRKLYGETIEFNLPNLRLPVGLLLVEEGRLRDHVWAAGRYWDLLYFALYRETWEALSARLLPRASTPDHRDDEIVMTVRARGSA